MLGIPIQKQGGYTILSKGVQYGTKIGEGFSYKNVWLVLYSYRKNRSLARLMIMDNCTDFFNHCTCNAPLP